MHIRSWNDSRISWNGKRLKVNNVVVHNVIKKTETTNDKMIKAGNKTKQKAMLKRDSHLQSDIITERKATRSGQVYF